MWKNCRKLPENHMKKDSLYKQTEARIEEICKNLEYKTYKDASKEQQRLSDDRSDEI